MYEKQAEEIQREVDREIPATLLQDDLVEDISKEEHEDILSILKREKAVIIFLDDYKRFLQKAHFEIAAQGKFVIAYSSKTFEKEKCKEYRNYVLRLSRNTALTLYPKKDAVLDKQEFWMEDVRNLSVDASSLIEERLKEFEITLTSAQEDKIHDVIFEVLESVSNGNYRREM